jgi:hypothetical protein
LQISIRDKTRQAVASASISRIQIFGAPVSAEKFRYRRAATLERQGQPH